MIFSIVGDVVVDGVDVVVVDAAAALAFQEIVKEIPVFQAVVDGHTPVCHLACHDVTSQQVLEL